MDFVVERLVVVEIKASEGFDPLHQAQLLSYLKLSGHKIGLLINFKVTVLRNGVKRMINDLPDKSFSAASAPLR